MQNTLFFSRNQTVYGPSAAAPYHQCDGDSDHEKVIFEAFSVLLAGPIHEETVSEMDRRHGHDHIAEDAEGRDPREESRDQTQGTG